MVETISITDHPEWDDLVAGASGEVFQTRRWLGVLADTFGLSFEAIVETKDGQLTAGLPFSLIEDIRGPRINILPFSDFTYPVISDFDQWCRLVEPLMEKRAPITISTAPDSVICNDERFTKTCATVRHHILLDDDLEALESRFASQPKRHIRRAEKAGLEFRLAETTEELRAFFELHFKIRKYRHGLLCQPYRLFEAIWQEFLEPGFGGLMLGFDGDTVVGGSLLIEAGDTLYYKYAASHFDYRSEGVSHAIVRYAMSLGLERGYAKLDLGRSDLDQPGLVDFKRRFGAVSEPLATFKWIPTDFQHPSAPGEMLGQLSRLLSEPDVPDATTERAGELMYRLFA